jgi:hypothetical protein
VVASPTNIWCSSAALQATMIEILDKIVSHRIHRYAMWCHLLLYLQL